MCQEVFQIAMSMDLKSVEMQLALQCAPLITGARISNMLMIDSADVRSAIQFNDSIEIFSSRDCFHIVTHFQKMNFFNFSKLLRCT